jgi:hypothetical protein
MFGIKARNRRLQERQRANAPWPVDNYKPKFEKRKPTLGGREEALLKAARLVLDDTPTSIEIRRQAYQALREAVYRYREG